MERDSMISTFDEKINSRGQYTIAGQRPAHVYAAGTAALI